MEVKIIKNFTENGIQYKTGQIVDEVTMSIAKMLDWIEDKKAIEVPDDAEERDTQKKVLKTSTDFLEFCNYAAAQDWGYVWGARGEIYNAAERDYLYNTYRTSTYDKKYYYETQWARWKNRPVCDCSGLIEAYSGINKTAQGFYAACTKKGTISSFPKTPGFLVFRYSSTSKKMTHVGVYDQNSKTIESKDSATGVVKLEYRQKNWTHWGQPHFIEMIQAPSSRVTQFTLSRLLKRTSPNMKGEDVKNVQKALVSFGFSVGSTGTDGIYGTNTYNAVRKFQKYDGLAADGIVGPDTTNALEGKWTGK